MTVDYPDEPADDFPAPPRTDRDRSGREITYAIADDADMDDIVEMYRDFDPADRTMGLPPATETQLRGWLDRFVDDGWSLVAEVDSTVVGHAGVTPGDAVAPHLVVFVADEAQGRGIGSELIRQLVAYAAERGHETLVLTVEAGNDAAITVYDNVGFDVVERLGGELEMHLSLDAPIAEAVRRPPAEREE